MSSDPTTSFSASGEDAITRVIDVAADQTADTLPPDEFDDFYDIERTAAEILKGDYKRIALQFPDELLHDSVPIFHRLTRRIGKGHDLYVLADTSYGSCCVDEVAASHVDADAMVHYGHACMSQTSRLPVIYVFGKKKLDIARCVDQLLEVYNADPPDASTAKSSIILKHDVSYTHQMDDLLSLLQTRVSSRNIDILYHKLPFFAEPASKLTRIHASEEPSDVSLDTTSIFYIGSESLGLTNLLMTNSSAKVISYDPKTHLARIESGRTNRLLMRRYAIVQKARDADVFGILVGTLGVASYLPLISHIRKLLSKSHKKSYTISVGKLNPAKLANFLEIECFILVACPENSVIESREFLRPIITPYELEVALQAEQSWTGKYVLEFGKLLSEAQAIESPQSNDATLVEGEEEDGDRPQFSLITGSYRYAKRYGVKDSEEDVARLVDGTSALVLRNSEGEVVRYKDSAAGQFLQQRTYQGLEVRLGEDAPSVLEQGRSGIARGYQDDKEHQSIE